MGTNKTPAPIGAPVSTRSAEAELVQQVFGSITTDGLPLALAETINTLAKVAADMGPDDMALQLDMPAGTLSFRAYRPRKGGSAMTSHEEREQLEAAIAERQRQIDRAATLQWCAQRAETPKVETVTKVAPAKEKQAMSQDISAGWRAYTDAANKSWVEAVTAATGELLAEERKKMRAELELEITKLRAEFLERELDRERGVKRLRSVPTDKSA